jgi:hypothetical protein
MDIAPHRDCFLLSHFLPPRHRANLMGEASFGLFADPCIRARDDASESLHGFYMFTATTLGGTPSALE